MGGVYREKAKGDKPCPYLHNLLLRMRVPAEAWVQGPSRDLATGCPNPLENDTVFAYNLYTSSGRSKSALHYSHCLTQCNVKQTIVKLHFSGIDDTGITVSTCSVQMQFKKTKNIFNPKSVESLAMEPHPIFILKTLYENKASKEKSNLDMHCN